MSSPSYLTAGDIVTAFRESGILSGDTVMLHSDALVAAQFPPMPAEERYDRLIDAILETVGPQGTLVIPTFTYSYTKDEIFDIRHSPSTVGAITERFRQRPGVLRSSDPLFSVAIQGRLDSEFSQARANNCFSEESIFGLLHQHNATIVCLGCHLSRTTFTHYVEAKRGVGYRYMKTFQGKSIDQDGNQHATSVDYYVRDMERKTKIDLSRLQDYLKQTNRIQVAAVGRVSMTAVKCHDFETATNELLDQYPYALIMEGKDNTMGQTIS